MPDGVQSFEFKPALMRGRDNWTLDGGFLTRNGELFCDLGMVDSARFAEMSSQRSYAAWLDLHEGKTRRRIACNIRRPSDQNREFMSLAGAVFEHLAERKPELKVAIGAGSGVRWAFFIMGALMVLGAIAFMIAETIMDAPQSEILVALIFCALFAGVGGLMAANNRPWAPPLELTADRARQVIARLMQDSEPAPGKGDGDQPEQDEGQGPAT
ncbi:MAG: hypothetical protein RIB03_12215 [Henriciella sp.]|uniref:hypothetical protein n=1 Tax=Henriciella sp. TaxID=1968823 RepID=UPI0032EBDB88